MAADSCETSENDDAAYGTHQNSCQKLFDVEGCIVGLQGESTPGMMFLEWFRLKDRNPELAVQYGERIVASGADFTAVVLRPDGTLVEYDSWLIPLPVTSDYYAVGSGAKAALGAMFTGCDAVKAVEAACAHDPYTRFPIHRKSFL
jgi:hypothetical protein